MATAVWLYEGAWFDLGGAWLIELDWAQRRWREGDSLEANKKPRLEVRVGKVLLRLLVFS